MATNETKSESQLDKFKEAARERECDEGENALDDKLKQIVKPEPAKEEKPE